MPRRLIVNADDLGADIPRNVGILEAHLRGMVTDTTLMVNMPGAEDAARRLGLAPRLGVGLHLNLAEGRPVLSGHRSLVGPDGAFWGKIEARRRLREGLIDLHEVVREVEAQLDRARDLGLRLDHVDGHHHIHIYPGVIEALAEGMKRRGIRWIRLPGALLDVVGSMAPDRRAALGEYATLTPPARAAALRSGLRTTEGFLGASLTGNLTVERVMEGLARAPEGVTELMVHPGYPDPASGPFSSPEREAELAVLTDPRLREGIARLGFDLVSFRDLG